MLKTIKNFIAMSLMTGLFVVPVLAPATVAAEQSIDSGLCAGANLDVTDRTCDPTNNTVAENKVNNIIKLTINLFSLVVGVVSVIMIIIGGLKYITSSGDSNNITSAKNTILYAIIGLVVVALAQFIVQFVLSRATTAGS